MPDDRNAIQVLKEISVALQGVYTARDKIILVRDGYYAVSAERTTEAWQRKHNG